MPKKWKPLWKGPLDDGITFSLTNRFLECRERFRLKVVEGVIEDEGFNRSLEFGNMWHTCEESIAAHGRKSGRWLQDLKSYYSHLLTKYEGNSKEISKWYMICKMQFRCYLQTWSDRPSYVFQERQFRVPYTLPSGRQVTLRGMFDAGFVKQLKRSLRLTLQENKTKGQIDEVGISQTVDENMQVMFYLIALDTCIADNKITCLGNSGSDSIKLPGKPMLSGVLYNVVRRPLSDNYAIRPLKSEVGGYTDPKFIQRLQGKILESPDHYFMRWNAQITKQDIEHFKIECFHPILEQLCDWWQWVSSDPDPWRIPTELDVLENCPGCLQGVPGGGIHYRTPFGLYNSLAGGFRGNYFDLLTKGVQKNLVHITTLYPELEKEN